GDDRPPSFLNGVVPLLTRQGCNQGACHGKGVGQNGFRLSLRGYAPEQDYRSLTREYGARRVETSVPEDSLLLRKAAGQAAHEGGQVVPVGSREYNLLLAWIRAGMPGPDAADARLMKLELVSAARALRPGEEVQLTVLGEFSDGGRCDLTWLTRFDSNDPG